MNIGAENTKKTAFAAGLFALALFLLIRMFTGGHASTPATPAHPTSSLAASGPVARSAAHRGQGAQPANGTATGPNLDPRLHLKALEEAENTQYRGDGRNIFLAQASEPVPIPAPLAPGLKKQPSPPPAPVVQAPPPIELKFFGFASEQGAKRVFLAKGDDVIVASEGDIVSRRYKIIKINANSIEVQDVLNNNRQTIPLTAG